MIFSTPEYYTCSHVVFRLCLQLSYLTWPVACMLLRLHLRLHQSTAEESLLTDPHRALPPFSPNCASADCDNINTAVATRFEQGADASTGKCDDPLRMEQAASILSLFMLRRVKSQARIRIVVERG